LKNYISSLFNIIIVESKDNIQLLLFDNNLKNLTRISDFCKNFIKNIYICKLILGNYLYGLRFLFL